MTVRFGIIGCGAIAESTYLPYFKSAKGAILNALVDTDENRYRFLAKGFNLAYTGKDSEAMFRHVDAVVVAVPNYLHYEIVKTCLDAGKHVLCEKPLAISSRDCEDLVRLSQSRCRLGVANVRRFYPGARQVKAVVAGREMGRVRSLSFTEGTKFSWNTVSGFLFDREKSGGGVLMDMGSHLIDMLLWWHPHEIVELQYRDDNLGGVEAFAKINFKFDDGVYGHVKLSRLGVLKNGYGIEFENGNLVWNPYNPGRIYIQLPKQDLKIIKAKRQDPIRSLMDDFIDAVETDRQPMITAENGLKVIQMIESCYAKREPLDLEWLRKDRGRDAAA